MHLPMPVLICKQLKYQRRHHVFYISNNSTYSVPAITSDAYTWTSTGGNITAGQGTNQITVQWNNGTVGTVSIIQSVP